MFNFETFSTWISRLPLSVTLTLNLSNVFSFSWDDCHTKEKWKTNPSKILARVFVCFDGPSVAINNSGGSRRGARLPPYYWTKLRPEEKFFPDHPPPPPLSKGLDDLPPFISGSGSGGTTAENSQQGRYVVNRRTVFTSACPLAKAAIYYCLSED